MVILSQDKENIINFDNVIGVQQGVQQDMKSIGVYFVNGEGICIGEYETEERAKEVLKDIARNIYNFESSKVGRPVKHKGFPVFEMPKE